MNDAIHRAAKPGATASSVLHISSSSNHHHQPHHQPQNQPSLLSQNQPNQNQNNNQQQQPQRILPPYSLSNPADSEVYFTSLLTDPSILSPRGAIGLLALTTRYFATSTTTTTNNTDVTATTSSTTATTTTSTTTPTQCQLYLKAVSHHSQSLLAGMKCSTDQKYVTDIIQAAGCAAVKCSRINVIRSGIIPVLEKLALGSRCMVRGVLTAAHVELMQCCLVGGHYRYAASFATSHPVSTVAPYKTSITMEQYLRYFYLLGMIYCGCNHKWEEAVCAFGLCLTVPSEIISAITIAARKKMLLAACLSQRYNHQDLMSEGGGGGGGFDLDSQQQSSSSARTAFYGWPWVISPCASQAVTKFFSQEHERTSTTPADSTNAQSETNINPEAPPNTTITTTFGMHEYEDLTKAFRQGEVGQFLKLKGLMKGLLQTDGNEGLVNQLQEEIIPNQMKKLANVYQVISLQVLRKKLEQVVSTQTAEEDKDNSHPQGDTILVNNDSILKMIYSFQDENYHAKIDEESHMVHFIPTDLPQENDSPEIAEELGNRMCQSMELASRVKKLDVGIATSQKYQAVLMKDQKLLGMAVGHSHRERNVSDLERSGIKSM